MTTLTNSEGRVLTYTNEHLDTMLLQLNTSSNYYTTGEHNIICINIDYNKLLLLDHTYYINRNIVHNYTINENAINNYDLELCEMELQTNTTYNQLYNGNGFIGIITELSNMFSDIRYPDRIGYIYRFRNH